MYLSHSGVKYEVGGVVKLILGYVICHAKVHENQHGFEPKAATEICKSQDIGSKGDKIVTNFIRTVLTAREDLLKKRALCGPTWRLHSLNTQTLVVVLSVNC